MDAMRATGGLLVVACAACSPAAPTGGPLSGQGPFLSEASGPVRSMVVTATAASRQAGTDAVCALAVDAFDPMGPISLGDTMSEGECTMYNPSASLMVEQQPWVCIGALDVSYPGHNDANAICPTSGHVPMGGYAFPLDCTSLTPSATIELSSGDDMIPGDAVTDLDVHVTLPSSAPSITQPTSQGVTTWPASGDLLVEWTGGAGATSALVTLSLVSAPAGSTPRIVCQPRTDGRTVVPAMLLDQAGLRGQDTVLFVGSYVDTTTMAGTPAQTWRASAGLATVALLQGRH